MWGWKFGALKDVSVLIFDNIRKWVQASSSTSRIFAAVRRLAGV